MYLPFISLLIYSKGHWELPYLRLLIISFNTLENGGDPAYIMNKITDDAKRSTYSPL